MIASRRSSRGRIHVGISGWTYAPWRGSWYPADLPHKRELEYASRQVSSIEINGTFYSLQRPHNFRAWYDSTPDDFVFSVKAPRYITHIRRLKDIRAPMANFFASGLLCLQEKLGPLLWQLPPSLRYEPEVMKTFFSLLPADSQAALRLARKHDDKVSGRVALPKGNTHQLRHAIEVRHPSFQCAEFVEQLREVQVALVVADTAGKWPFMEDVTSDFMYLRLHGDQQLYVSGYTPNALKEWGRKIDSWAHGRHPRGARTTAGRPAGTQSKREVFVYFDNDVKVHAPNDAMRLARELGVPSEHALHAANAHANGDSASR